MQQPAMTPWRLPMTSMPPPPTSTKVPYLQHTNSMLNLHNEPTWHWPLRSPPSPTASSTSSASRSATPTASLNPWAAAALASSMSTPMGTPGSQTPRYSSRSATPLAPNPVRPGPMSGNLTPPSPVSPARDQTPCQSEIGGSPVTSPVPNPYRATNAPTTLPPVPTNVYITPAVLTQYGLTYADIFRRQGWGSTSAKLAYQWATSNPRTALLLLMCDDVAALRKVTIFGGLEDYKLPHSEAALEGIAANPRKVVEMQWRVMVQELPQNGQHTEFRAREEVPLESLGTIKTSGAGKCVDKVRWLVCSDDKVYARKRLVYGTQAQKATMLAQIQRFRSVEHPNIARLFCSYSHTGVIGIVTTHGQYTLEDYLQLPPDPHRAKLLLDWINDLTQALAHIHSHDISHKSIRPHKILIDGSRIFFSAFGIASSASDNSSSRSSSSSPTRPQDPSASIDPSPRYIYAAPETITRGKLGRHADVFALGCVFLTMLTAAKGRSVADFHAYLASSPSSRDPSFHANLDRVQTWLHTLSRPSASSTSSSTRRDRDRDRPLVAAEKDALDFVAAMLIPDPLRRVRMKKLAPHVAEWNEARARSRTLLLLGRRRSLDAVVQGGFVRRGEGPAGTGVVGAQGQGMGMGQTMATMVGSATANATATAAATAAVPATSANTSAFEGYYESR